MKNLGGVSRLLLFSECLNPSVRISFLEDNQLAHRHINMRIYFPFSIQKQQKLCRIWDYFFFNGKYVHLSVKRPAKRQTNQEGERRIFKLEREPTTIAGSFDLHKNHTKCRYMGMRKERIRGWDPRSSHLPLNHPKQGPHFLRASQHQAAPLFKVCGHV